MGDWTIKDDQLPSQARDLNVVMSGERYEAIQRGLQSVADLLAPTASLVQQDKTIDLHVTLTKKGARLFVTDFGVKQDRR